MGSLLRHVAALGLMAALALTLVDCGTHECDVTACDGNTLNHCDVTSSPDGGEDTFLTRYVCASGTACGLTKDDGSCFLTPTVACEEGDQRCVGNLLVTCLARADGTLALGGIAQCEDGNVCVALHDGTVTCVPAEMKPCPHPRSGCLDGHPVDCVRLADGAYVVRYEDPACPAGTRCAALFSGSGVLPGGACARVPAEPCDIYEPQRSCTRDGRAGTCTDFAVGGRNYADTACPNGCTEGHCDR